MAQYSEELETKFREGSRGKNIANTPLGELIAGRVDTYSERAKKNAIDYFEDIIDLTPEELKDKPELFREAMVGSSYEQYGKNKGPSLAGLAIPFFLNLGEIKLTSYLILSLFAETFDLMTMYLKI